jgi:hypothetical protein
MTQQKLTVSIGRQLLEPSRRRCILSSGNLMLDHLLWGKLGAATVELNELIERFRYP